MPKNVQALPSNDFLMLESILQTYLMNQISTDWWERFSMLDTTVLQQEKTSTGEQLKLLLLPLWSKTVIMFVFLDKTLKEEHSLTDMLMFSIRTKMAIIFQLITLYHKEISEDSLLLIHISLNLQFLALNWDMQKLIQILFVYGKPNLEISQMELRLSSISSFHQEKPNGMWRTE